MALAGLFLVLGTVHIWGAVSVFIMFYLGAGAWIYSAEAPGPSRQRGGRGAALRPPTRRPGDTAVPAGPRRGRGQRETEVGLSA